MATVTSEKRQVRPGDVVEMTRHQLDGSEIVSRGVCVRVEPGLCGPNEAQVEPTGPRRRVTFHSSYPIGDGPDDWRVVPDEDRTWEERVLAASAKWEPPTWRNEEDLPHEPSEYAWALLSAIRDQLVPDGHERADEPMTYGDLIHDLALRLDGTLPSTGALLTGRPRPCLAARQG